MQHTPEQAAIIEADVGNLLVSAAAGSGKTAVLTDRIVRRIIDGHLDVRQVLVMTFTEAAARSMKDKIEGKLQAALNAGLPQSERRRISRQLALLPGAAISTIHAFCLDVIRNFYYCARDKAGQPLIEPGFGVEDGVESDLMLRQALDEVMSSQYEAIDQLADQQGNEADMAWTAAFYRLVEGYGGSRGDQTVRELILNLHRFLRSLPNYAEFIQKRLTELQAAADDFSASPHAEALLRMLKLRLDRAVSQFDELQNLLDGNIRFIADATRNQSYCRQFQAALQTLSLLSSYLESGGRDWDHIREITGGLSEITLPRANRADSPEKQAFMAVFCEYVAEVIHFLSGNCGTSKCKQYFIFDSPFLFNLSAAEISADITDMLPAVRKLFDLVLALDTQYAAHKKAAGVIDFSDFEHLALAILREEEARQYYRQRFLEVYVDEYQDTSSIQEEIIRAVSTGNCLMVGDVKQSIYRFRHARPRIFIDKAASFKAGEAGKLHELNRNFRSVAGILAAANDLFSQLMSRGAGEIEYDESQALKSFRPDHPECPVPVNLMILNRLPAESPQTGDADASDGQAEADDEQAPDSEAETVDANELTRDQQEALLVVRQMQQLHEQGHPWTHMVVLGRTRTISQSYQTVLESFGIPTEVDTAESFLDTPVLRQLEALIHLLDNFRQDIPLAAIMRSGLFQGGFTDEEMLRIRIQAKKQDPGMRFFHEAVLHYACEGSDLELRKRVADFLVWLENLRDREQFLLVGELVSLIYAETGWLDRLAASTDGEQQVRQARQFQQWAELFEGRRQRGLYAFARYLESLRSRGPVESPFAPETDERDAVRIMTIHRSKGLEFPIVFLVGTGYGLKPKDSKDNLLLSENLGIGMDYADPEVPIRYPTHLKLAMMEEIKAAGLAEELRLLYVAVTRAMDQLHIVGTVRLRPGKGDTHLSHLLQQTKKYPSRQLPDHLVLSGQNYLDWILIALARQPGLDWSWLETGILPAEKARTDETADSAWTMEFHQLETLQAELNTRSINLHQQAAPPETEGGPIAAADPACLIKQVISDPTPFNLADDDFQKAWQLTAAPYRYEQAARTPVKLTVSELKRRENLAGSALPPEEDGVLLTCLPTGRDQSRLMNDPRGIGLVLNENHAEKTAAVSEDAISPAQFGSLLHEVFRYLDVPAASRNPVQAEIERQLAAMASFGMFSQAEIAALKPLAPAIAAFAGSRLATEMAEAIADPRRPIHQEMPFTLALPANEVYSAAGLNPEDRVLVQGIIDCWYENKDGVTLIDFKSDRLTGDYCACLAELRSRYCSQLDYYARAIQAATGKTVTRRLIWMIRQGRAYELDTDEART